MMFMTILLSGLVDAALRLMGAIGAKTTGSATGNGLTVVDILCLCNLRWYDQYHSIS